MPQKTVHAAAPRRPRLPRAAAPTLGSLNLTDFQRAQEAAASKRAAEEAEIKRRTMRTPTPKPIVKPVRGNAKNPSGKKGKKDILNKAKGGKVEKKPTCRGKKAKKDTHVSPSNSDASGLSSVEIDTAPVLSVPVKQGTRNTKLTKTKTKKEKKKNKEFVPEKRHISKRKTGSGNLSSSELTEQPVIKRQSPRRKILTHEPSEGKEEVESDEIEVEIKVKGKVNVAVVEDGGDVHVDIEEDEDEDGYESEDEEVDWAYTCRGVISPLIKVKIYKLYMLNNTSPILKICTDVASKLKVVEMTMV